MNPSNPNAKLSDLLYLALNEPLGLWLRTPNPHRLKYALYAARAQCGDPALDKLQVRTNPANQFDELWLVNASGALRVEDAR